ncbi:MAG: hypothetical protein ACRDRL_11345 [Sciscionella sp.]
MPWPTVDEDQVRRFAQHVCTFAQSIDETHQVASSTIARMNIGYQGSSYERLVAGWARMSDDHKRERLQGHADEVAGHARAFGAAIAGVGLGG